MPPYTQQSNPYTGEWMSFDTPQQYSSWVSTLQTPPTTGPGGTPGGAGEAWTPDQQGYGSYMDSLAQSGGANQPRRTPSFGLPNTPINMPFMNGIFGSNPFTGQVSAQAPGAAPQVNYPSWSPQGQANSPAISPSGQTYHPQGELSRTGFGMSLVPGMSQPTPAPLLPTYLQKFVDAAQGGFVTNLITGGQSSIEQEMQNIIDQAASWAQLNPGMAGSDWRERAQQVANQYGQWAQSAMYNGRPLSSYDQGPSTLSTYPGQGQPWWPGATYNPVTGNPTSTMWSGGSRGSLSPGQFDFAATHSPTTQPWGGAGTSPGVSYTQTPGGTQPGSGYGTGFGDYVNNPSLINDINQLLYQAGAGGNAGTPGVVPPTTPSSGTPPGPSTNPASPSNNAGSGTPDQTLAYNAGDVNYLRDMLARNGIPVDSVPAWQSMMEAQERQIGRGRADLAESFNVSGNRFSNAFGTAATDYETQARRDQNSTLAQMLLSSQNAAADRTLAGSTALAGMANGGLQQLSSQDFQARMAQQQQQLQAALAMLSQGGSAAQLMAQLGASGASQLNQGAIQGAQGLYGTENQAAMAEVQRQLVLQGMSNENAVRLSQLWQSNLGLGSQLGGQQYSIGQDQINRQYQEWMRQQAQYNPLLPFMMQGSGMYPQMFMPQYPQSNLGSILGGIGGLAGAAPGLISAISNLFNGGGSSGSGGSGFNLGSIFSGMGSNPFIFF